MSDAEAFRAETRARVCQELFGDTDFHAGALAMRNAY